MGCPTSRTTKIAGLFRQTLVQQNDAGKMMYSCRMTAKLKNESFNRKLSLKERAGLRLHFFMCRGCQRVSKQLELIHKVTRKLFTERAKKSAENDRLSDQARDRISVSMKKNPDSDD